MVSNLTQKIMQTSLDRHIVKTIAKNRSINAINPNTIEYADRIAAKSGQYSKNPIKNIISWLKQFKTNL
ncbi:MAG: hypothetical protein ACI4S3_09055 [Candidatus Gastranaerophilaceae bacterium]